MTLPIRFYPQHAEVDPGTSLEFFASTMDYLMDLQRDILWHIGDVARALAQQHPDHVDQATPVGAQHEHISRCKAIAAAYKPDERNILATWSVHKNYSKSPDRVALVEASVEAGQSSDEARKNPIVLPDPQEPEPEPVPAEPDPEPERTEEPPAHETNPGWLLAVDLNYYVQRSYPKDGVDTAGNVCSWLSRLIGRLQEEKGLTDVVVCFDSRTNHRRAITDGWEQPYKERTHKDPELVTQLVTVRELIQKLNLACVEITDMEADDVMASYAKQFAGKVTLMTADKDLRQCLSPTCNILRDVKWENHPETGQLQQVYEWVVGEFPEDKKKPANVSCHMKDGCNYSGTKVVGITPEQWPHFQAIAGDSTDDIQGCVGIGGKGAMDLIKAHGSVQAVISACKNGQAALTAKKVEAVLAFEPFSEAMLKLTTLRTDLAVPQITRIALKESREEDH